MPWTDRVEAVESYVFDLDGNVAATPNEPNRVPGCYTLPEAIELTRNAVSYFFSLLSCTH